MAFLWNGMYNYSQRFLGSTTPTCTAWESMACSSYETSRLTLLWITNTMIKDYFVSDNNIFLCTLRETPEKWSGKDCSGNVSDFANSFSHKGQSAIFGWRQLRKATFQSLNCKLTSVQIRTIIESRIYSVYCHEGNEVVPKNDEEICGGKS